MNICADFETRSAVDLKTFGPWKYAADPSTDIICLSVKENDGHSWTWLPDWVLKKIDYSFDSQSNEYLRGVILRADKIEAHNCEFERAIWHHIMHKRYGFPDLDLNKCYCSAAAGAYMNLPRKLEMVCEVLRLQIQKDSAGHALMMKMCKPRKPSKAEKAANPNWSNMTFWHESPEDILRLIQYCNTDTDAEYGVSKVVAPLTPIEREIWLLDQRINQRGLHVDLLNVNAIVSTLAKHEIKLLEEFGALTGNQVESPRQVKEFRTWLTARGVQTENLQKQTVEDLLKTNLPEDARKALVIRQALGKASTSKFTAMENRAQEDSRCRALFMYSGAGTHRATAKAIQPQNMVRDSFSGQKLEDAYEAFRIGDIEWIKFAFGDPFPVASRCLRGAVSSAPGKIFRCADYSSIEGRGNAWQAGDEDKLKQFRKEDDGTGPKVYNVTAASVFGIDPYKITKDMPEYLVGKVQELALGYQGGIGAFASMAKNYNLDLETLPPLVMQYAEKEELIGPWGANSLASRYLKRNPGSMSFEAAVACDVLKRKWRVKNDPIKRSWKQLESAAVQAVANPGQVFIFRGMKYRTWVDPNKNRYLLCQLPSGRILYYFEPKMKRVRNEFLDPDEFDAEGKDQYRDILTCYTMTDKNQWVRRPLYGGLLCERVRCVSHSISLPSKPATF